MTWIGTWHNQYGSVVEISDDTDGRIGGTFRTVLPQSGFYGKTIRLVGLWTNDVISFGCAAPARSGDAAVSYTGRLVDGKLETLWHVVNTNGPWPLAVTTGADTFQRC